MLRRRFTLSLIALVNLQLLGFGTRAEADYGVESKRPLSDPHQASIDNRPVGTWRAVIQEKTYYLHVGTGNIVGQSNWMELVLVNPGEKPTFYLHHKVGFPSTIGDMSFFNVANMSVLISQLRGSRTSGVWGLAALDPSHPDIPWITQCHLGSTHSKIRTVKSPVDRLTLRLTHTTHQSSPAFAIAQIRVVSIATSVEHE